MIVKAIITTLDNLPCLQESVTVLRSEPVDEIIIVSNGSIDGTNDWLATQSDLTVVYRENNGAGPGRNAGLDVAGDYDYVLMLDGGMRAMYGSVGHMLDYLKAIESCDVIAIDWNTLETDYEKAWRRWPKSISKTYRNKVISLTHYCLCRARAWDGYRFAEHGPFGEPGWGCDDDEMAHRWLDGGIIVHAVEGIRAYRHASGSFDRLYDETGIWPNQYGSVYEKRLVWMQQFQPQHCKGVQWGEPWITVVIEAYDIDYTIRLIKYAHVYLRKRKFPQPNQKMWQPYSIVLWNPSEEVLKWAGPRMLRQHHGDTIILDEYGPDRQVIRKCSDNEADWTGDFRIYIGDDWRDAVRQNAHYYGLIKHVPHYSVGHLASLLYAYERVFPAGYNIEPDVRCELEYI